MHSRKWAAVPILYLVISACTVHFVSDYDELTDRTVTELQTRVEVFLVSMSQTAGTPSGTYNSNREFYNENKAILATLTARNSAIPQNQSTIDQLKLLGENLDTLASLHKEGGEQGLTAEVAEPIHAMLDVQFRAIIKHELDKKRGK